MQLENALKNGNAKEPCTLVIFGGSGDLSQRKLIPAVYHLFALEQLHENFHVIAYGMPEMTNEEYQALVVKSLETFYKKETPIDFNEFSKRFSYVSGGFEDKEKYQGILDVHLEKASKDVQMIYYMAIPPVFAKNVIGNLGEKNFKESGIPQKVIMEKPFGVNKESAKELDSFVLKTFTEDQIYRIDHYLGKETVQNIMFLRFGNHLFEPQWNRSSIDHIQITVAEDLGVGHRAKFYEGAGVVRDIIQNHALQLLALVTMEPPATFNANMIRDEKLKILKSIRPFTPERLKTDVIKGQYGPGDGEKGYREENDFASESVMPTYFAAKFHIDNWRWAEVPIYMRAGKRLKKKVTEIYIQFKKPPLSLFGDNCNQIVPNGLLISVQPNEEISMRLNTKFPGSENFPHPIEMKFNYEELGEYTDLEAYERLILDCLKGDQTLFARKDEIETMWEIVDPINQYFEHEDKTELPNYAVGTWGPEAAKKLMSRDGRFWRMCEECLLGGYGHGE